MSDSMMKIYEQPPSDGCADCGSTEGLTLLHGIWLCGRCRAYEETPGEKCPECGTPSVESLSNIFDRYCRKCDMTFQGTEDTRTEEEKEQAAYAYEQYMYELMNSAA